MSTVKFEKDLSFLRSWILGKEWWSAHDAMEFAKSRHRNMRKDGKTPEFHHQVQIGLSARTLVPYFLYPEETLSVCFLHDILEDFDDVSGEEIEERFGKRTLAATELVTKKRGNTVKPYEDYFDAMSSDPIASVVKGLDRCHNIWTMRGVFDHKKRDSYIGEIDQWFLPMLKTARRRFPQQEPCYQNIAHQLRVMRDIYLWAHDELESQRI